MKDASLNERPADLFYSLLYLGPYDFHVLSEGALEYWEFIDSVLVQLHFGLLVLFYLDIANEGRYYIAQGHTSLPILLETLVLHLQLVLFLFRGALHCQSFEVEFVLRGITDALDIAFYFRLVIFGHTAIVLNGLE